MAIMDRLPDVVKSKLPFFQFGAVVLTIGLASHTILTRFSAATPSQQLETLLKGALCFETVIVPGTTVTGRKKCLPPIEFDGVDVMDAPAGGKAIVKTRFRRNRKNCPFVDWAPVVLAANGVQYGVTHSLNKALTPPNPENPDQLTDVYQISLDRNMPSGPAEYRASINYSCPDSVLAREIVYYPSDLKFCVLHPDGSRPLSCGAK